MKTRILVTVWLFVALVGFSANTNQFKLPLAKLRVLVQDESGNQVTGAKVSLAFMDEVTGQGIAVEGITGSDGLFSGTGGSDSSIGSRVTKDGYYRGRI